MLFGFSGYAQEIPQNPPCATDAIMESLIRNRPEVKQHLDNIDKYIAENRNSNSRISSALPPSGTYTIPVVVYVVHDGTAQTNVSDSQVNAQMLALNDYFLNTGIKFCLATKVGSNPVIPTVNTTDVQTTPGIIHVNNSSLSNHSSTTAQQELVETAHPTITRDKYLRIWIVKSIDGVNGGTLGYSMFPNTSSVFDGIVMRYNVFGNGSANLNPNYNQGKVLVHEVAHYLGIYHTFEGSCVTAVGDCHYDGDRVCDTPPVAAPNFYCVAGTNSCVETPAVLDDLSNYMDYNNHFCADHFTTGQMERMIDVLTLIRPGLVTSENTVYTGVCGYENLFVSTITPSAYSICSGSAVNFNVVFTSGTIYSWDFGDAFSNAGNPNTSSVQNPSHIFTLGTNSPYTVTLNASRIFNGVPQTSTSTIEIFVSDCTPIDNEDAYWYISSALGLDFSSGIPTFDSTFPTDLAHHSQYGCNMQNDASGGLLFYTNNKAVWNKQHQRININDVINGNNWLPNSGMTLIVPKPTPTGTQMEYYIFSNQYLSALSTYPDQGFRYNIVNVSGTNATMGVEKQPVTLAPSLGFDSLSDGALYGGSSVAAVQKCNGYDYWIITVAKKGNVSYLVVFSLTNSGLAYNSEILLFSPELNGGTGRIEIAPNGNKLLFYDEYGQLYKLFDFNKADGILNNPVSLPGMWVANASFSPDSQLLYFTTFYDKTIVQYHINSTNIPNTSKVVATTQNKPMYIQTAPDGKMYVGMYYQIDRLAVIHNPNALSTTSTPNACNFSENGPNPSFYVPYGVGSGLPNIIDAKVPTSYFSANAAEVISVYITGCKSYKFFPNICGTSFKWTFTNSVTGASVLSTETNPNYTFPQNGTYIVTLRDNSDVLLGTSAPIVITDSPTAQIVGSQSACLIQPNASVTNNSTFLAEGETAQWSIVGGVGNITGTNSQSSVNIAWTSLPGTISLSITNVLGCTNTVTKIIASDCSALGDDDFDVGMIKVLPNPSKGIFNITASAFTGKTNFTVADMSGRIVYNSIEENFSGDKMIDLSTLQSAVYILKITGEGLNYTAKLVRN